MEEEKKHREEKNSIKFSIFCLIFSVCSLLISIHVRNETYNKVNIIKRANEIKQTQLLDSLGADEDLKRATEKLQ